MLRKLSLIIGGVLVIGIAAFIIKTTYLPSSVVTTIGGELVGNEVSGKQIFTERFVLVNTKLGDTVHTNDIINRVMESMRVNGYNGMYLGDSSQCSVRECSGGTGDGDPCATGISCPGGGTCQPISATCATNIANVKAKAVASGITIIPQSGGTENIGGSNFNQVNSEAFPIRGTKFKVNDTGISATAVNELPETDYNADMSVWSGGYPVGWTRVGLGTVSQETSPSIVYGGTGSSVKITGPGTGGTGTTMTKLIRTLPVNPHRVYNISVRVKTAGWKNFAGANWDIFGNGGYPNKSVFASRLKYLGPYSRNSQLETQGWTEYTHTFFSVVNSSVTVWLQLPSTSDNTTGSVWIDELHITELGLSKVVESPRVDNVVGTDRPIVVKSLDNSITYTKGTDYVVSTCEGRCDRTLSIPPGSRITAGSFIRVHWWRLANVKWEYSAMPSWCRPGTIAAHFAQVKSILDVWYPDPNSTPQAIKLPWDENYAFGYDPACGTITSNIPGEAGRYVAERAMPAMISNIRSLRPNINIAMFSDMHAPNWNAQYDFPWYQLVNGSMEGAWLGAPPDIYMSTWTKGGTGKLPPYSDANMPGKCSNGSRWGFACTVDSDCGDGTLGGHCVRTGDYVRWFAGKPTQSRPVPQSQVYPQIIGGYYGSLYNDQGWANLLDVLEAEGVRGIKGYVYQSYDTPEDFSDLGPVADMWKAEGRWGTGPAFSGTNPPTNNPIANTGPTHPLTINTPHTHTGASATDSNNNLSSYTWSLISCPGACPTLSGSVSGSLSGGSATIPSGPTYTPTQIGSYTLQLRVTDATGLSDTKTIIESTSGVPSPTPTPTKTPTPTPIVTPTSLPSPSPTPSSGLKIGDRVKVNVSTLYVKSSPSGAIINQVTLNTQGTIMSGPTPNLNLTWWEISYDNGIRGWSAQGSGSTQYLVKVTGSGPTPTPPPSPSPGITPIANPSPSPTPIQSNALKIGDRIRVNVNVLNVRSSSFGAITNQVTLNTQGTIMSGPTPNLNFIWWEISYDNGIRGWSAQGSGSTQYLVKATGPAPTPSPSPGITPIANPSPSPTPSILHIGDRIRVNVNVLNVRSSPFGAITNQVTLNTQGTIMSGPTPNLNFIWWEISYDNSVRGWSADGDARTRYLLKI